MELVETYQDAAPDLDQYLENLWAAIRKKKDVKGLPYSLIVEMLNEAFVNQSLPFLYWDQQIHRPFEDPQKSESNTPEYFAEIETYEYIERVLVSQIIDLKRIKSKIPPHDKYWMNFDVYTYLERATSTYQNSDFELEEVPTWHALGEILHCGKYYE